jgi:protein SCO1
MPHPEEASQVNSPNKKYLKSFGIVAILLFPALCYFILTAGKHNIISLPYYGNKDVVKNTIDGREQIDTIYHSVRPFSFTNQEGIEITEATFKDKIYIADFFFTTCPGICPKMSAQMHYVEERLKDFPEVLFLSHTVDPEKDSVEALAKYAELVHANTKRWHFVTGKKEEIYKQAFYGYLLNADEDILAPGGFLHSEMFVLVDKRGHIRGFYDGTSVDQAKKLIDAVKVLMAEEQIPRKSKKL